MTIRKTTLSSECQASPKTALEVLPTTQASLTSLAIAERTGLQLATDTTTTKHSDEAFPLTSDNSRHLRSTAEALQAVETGGQPTSLERPVYWCTVCLQKKRFKSRDSWRRHEKKHEAFFKCKLGGPQQFSAGAEDDHRDGQPATCSASRSLKSAMAGHLKLTHGVLDGSLAKQMASQFEVSSGKAFWSCGLCICHFGSFNERLNHVRNHFKEHPTPDQWRLTTEILGLLGQPHMGQIWAQLLEARHGQHRIEVTWQESEDTDSLKLKLQMGASEVNDAQRLTEEAYALSNLAQAPTSHNLSNSSHNDPMDVVNVHELQAANSPTPSGEDLGGSGGELPVLSDDSTNPHTSGAFTFSGDIDPSPDPMLFTGSSPRLDDFDDWGHDHASNTYWDQFV